MEQLNSRVSKLLLSSILVFVCSCVCSCAAKQRVTGVSDTFLKDVDITSKRANLPYEHAWVNPDLNRSKFTSVYIKPIRTDLLPADGWQSSASAFVTSKEEYLEKAQEIAEYFRSELIAKANESQAKRLQLVDTPSVDTLVVEIALTELELSHPVARAGSLLAPIPGTGAAVSSISDPHVAFAARLTDGSNGQLVATAADRKFAPTRILDLNKLTVSSSAREISALWAATMAQALQGDGLSKIDDTRFDWKPW